MAWKDGTRVIRLGVNEETKQQVERWAERFDISQQEVCRTLLDYMLTAPITVEQILKIRAKSLGKEVY